MRKTRTRRLLTWFLVLMMLVSLAPAVSAASLTDLSKTVSETPKENGELDITLTVSGKTVTKNQPLNLLLVIDLSNSMALNLAGEEIVWWKPNQDKTSRLKILQKALTYTDSNTTSFLDSLESEVGKGNLYVDIVTFGSKARNELDWTNNLETVKSTINGLSASGGTNYQDALAKAQKAAESQSDVRVIFLSDGLPTFYGANGTSSNGDSCSVTNLEQTYTQMRSYAADSHITFRSAIAYATDPKFDTAREGSSGNYYRYSNVNLLGPANSYASGTYQTSRNGYSWSNGSSDQNIENLSIPSIGYNAYQTANNESDLLNSLNAIVKGFNLSSVSITDPMHETHVQENIDLASLHTEGTLKVSLVDEDGEETLLEYQADYTVTGSTINYNHDLMAGQTLKVVATVKVSDAPGEYYFENQSYKDVDADGNQGFFSNQSASASGTVDEEDYSGNYLNPVFKLNTTSLTIRKISSANSEQNLSGATFTITRKADSSSTTGVTRSETTTTDDGETISNPITYTTGEDGSVIIPNLPYGYYELTETNSPNGFKLLETPLTFTVNYLGQITSNDDRLLPLTGSASDGFTATVTNEPNDVTLTVTKNLEGTAKNAADTFPFTLSADGVDSVSKSIGQGGTVTITVPYGKTVKVAETDSNGYTATVDSAEGQTPAITDWASDGKGYSGTITLTENTAITITNTKDAPVVTGFITDTSGTSGIALVSITMISLGALLIYLKKRHF